nr:thiamine biosynthesis protein [Rhodochaete parvula]
MNISCKTESKKISVEINGESFNCVSPISLYSLLEYLDFNISTVIIEHNATIISHENLYFVELKNNDKVEVVTIVGGG